MGAAARYGEGDVQWLTAGAGIQHAEMFPLLNKETDNPVELFQIWLNLPRSDKFVQPYFSMLWNDTIPVIESRDDAGNTTTVRVIAGRFDDHQAPKPPPNSWAARDDSDLAIFTIKMAPNARIHLPAMHEETTRSLYFFKGSTVHIRSEPHTVGHRLDLEPGKPVLLVNSDSPAELLLLAARPINEPVAQYGPFVMNTPAEIHQAFADYRRTQFGGWPWDRTDPVHGSEPKRFARYGDGTYDEPV